MKVERNTLPGSSRAVTTAVADVLPQTSDALVAEFTAALRQHRRNESSQRDDARPRSNERQSSRAQPRTAKAESERRYFGMAREPAFAELTHQIAEDARSLQTLPLSTDPALHAAPSTGQSRDMKRRRFKENTDPAAPCIEIVHADTDTRCTLSREGDVWILSFESQPFDSTQHAGFVEALRAQFAATGLGAIDVIF